MTIAPSTKDTTQLDWEPEYYNPPPSDLPYDDGEPLESSRHLYAMTTLIRSVEQAFAERTDYFVGGNMFVYFSATQAKNRDFRGPDFFFVANVDGSYERRTWTVWEENGIYPDVIIELMSESTASVDLQEKKEIYERTFRTREYYVFDPFNPDSLQGWRLNGKLRYQPLTPDERGWLRCETLGFWLGTWAGTIGRDNLIWLRFYDNDGNVVPLPEEVAENQGREQGLQEGMQRSLLRLLERRFGTITETVSTNLSLKSLEKLESLLEVAMEVKSLEEFLQNLT
ncbi:MAG: Uma2 family endonuclease [Oscillatoria sp. PMC 1068.18]|nr:Uma2 family endonuclease [Oscillatoria sp. PMC 1076.18]MEC4990997.1 Uma2 family endonuclease [Oscillatoria sp. PMC 1068.18]